MSTNLIFWRQPVNGGDKMNLDIDNELLLINLD